MSRVFFQRTLIVCLLSLTAIGLAALSGSSAPQLIDWSKQTKVKKYTLKVEKGYRHDLSAFTQGLFIHEGKLYESTGQNGASEFRQVDLQTGRVLRRVSFPQQYFGEGSCVIDGRAYVLTWHAGVCFVYDIASFNKLAELRYDGEGWGLTTDGKQLIMSDGTAKIVFRDPMTFQIQRTIQVKAGSREIPYLNELEYIGGKIWANVYGWDTIVIINPESGQVEGRINCAGLLEREYKTKNIDVLNGIAYDAADGSVYLTGKYWPRLYKVSLEEK